MEKSPVDEVMVSGAWGCPFIEKRPVDDVTTPPLLLLFE